MTFRLSAVVHDLMALVKYIVALVVLVIAAKLAAKYLHSRLFVDSDDMAMRSVIPKSTVKVNYDPMTWSDRQIRRENVIVVNMPFGPEQKMKKFPYRVIAVGGDRISTLRGEYTINGEKEAYPGVKLVADPRFRMSTRIVPRGYLYAVPDNRIDCKSGWPEFIPAWRVVGKTEI